MTTDSKNQLHTRDNSIKTMLDVKKTEISDILPDHINIDRFIKSALLVIAGNEKLEQCSVESIVKSVIGAAELGLDFTPAKGLAYLVPFYSSKKKTMEAVFMPGYRGLIHLARNTGIIKNIEAHIVYENDLFDVIHGSHPELNHTPLIFGDRGKRLGAYAIAFFREGGFQFELMTEEELMKIKNKTKSKDKSGKIFGPWLEYEDELIKKTPIRRLFKMLPSGEDHHMLTMAIQQDNDVAGVVDTTRQNQPTQIAGSQTKSLAQTLQGSQNTKSQPEPEDADFKDIDKKEKPADKKTKTSKKDEKPPADKEAKPDPEQKPDESKESEGQKNFMDDSWKPE